MSDSTNPKETLVQPRDLNPYQANVSPADSIRVGRRRTLRRSATLGAVACSVAPLLAFGGARASEFLNGTRPWTELPNQLIILGALIGLFGIAGALIGAIIRFVGKFLIPEK
ncbi:hypothetical protein VN12_04875 [Pirellula sp. SH-Sr6A]|uniref:hypothetical protein n=1 Tax=Pirellula sp. SH-Sr6A TaxID=1632865 RepID=UPI00078C7168|nr:hypothetical protein [Pirellula sp. SH-Sr6A]AMV31429.1 hypothetical protein VN12_04875 [Pirellula sp. SH-Sr6A]